LTVVVKVLVAYDEHPAKVEPSAAIFATSESNVFVTTIGEGVGVGFGVGVTAEVSYRGHPASDAILSECSIVTIPFSPQTTTDQLFLAGAVKRSSSRYNGLATPASRV
jgi:hypothetical protein